MKDLSALGSHTVIQTLRRRTRSPDRLRASAASIMLLDTHEAPATAVGAISPPATMGGPRRRATSTLKIPDVDRAFALTSSASPTHHLLASDSVQSGVLHQE
jgi:hypothetical protein